jgi:uncharacterized protein YbaR (Trm112 family)
MSANVICSNCQGMKRNHPIAVDCSPGAKLKGVVTCLECNHAFPIVIQNGFITEQLPSMPISQSSKLSNKVPSDIKEYVQEAETAYFHECYKSSVIMCRRALQLSLIEKGIPDNRLGVMLDNAKSFFDEETFQIAKSIKYFGDVGVHRKFKIDTFLVGTVIYLTTTMLNELYNSELPPKLRVDSEGNTF